MYFNRFIFLSTFIVCNISFLEMPNRIFPYLFAFSEIQSPCETADADCLLNQGIQQYQAGQLTDALQSFQQALERYRINADQKGEADALNNLGETYRSLTKYPESITNLEQALRLMQTLKNTCPRITRQRRLEIQCNPRRGEAAVSHNLSLIYEALGEEEKATEFHTLAESIEAEFEWLQTGVLTASGGRDYYHSPLYFSVRASGDQDCLDLDPAVPQPELDSTLAAFLSSYNLELSSSGNRRDEAIVLSNRARIYEHRGYCQLSLAEYQQALAIFQEIGDRAEESRITSSMARVSAKQKQPGLAIALYKQAVKIIESIRADLRELSLEQQQSYTETVADTYRALANLLLEQGRILEAQQVLELLKVEELREFTEERAKFTSDGIQFTKIEQEIVDQHSSLIEFGRQVIVCQQTRCSELDNLLDQRELLTQEFNQTVQAFEAEMRNRLPDDSGVLDTRNFKLTAQKIVEAQSGTVLIYPFVLKDKLWLLWSASGGVVDSIEVPVTQKELGETVLQFRQLLSTPTSNMAQVQATAKQLYDWLILPLKQELSTSQTQHLVFSLDRVTRYIPIAALFDGEHYLIEQYTISTILSAGLTDVSDRFSLSTQNTPILAFGLSEAVPPDFRALPNVPAELDAIVLENASDPNGIYAGSKFLNRDFNEQTLRNNLFGHRILHIATHAVFVPGHQDQSYLLLGTGERLKIADIQNLQDLGELQLVILSACETALGEADQEGVEIPGIAFNFLNGGADTVIASLWSVSDRSTSNLMQQFYRTLASGTVERPITRAQALQQAQLSLLHDGEDAEGADRGVVGVRPNPSVGVPETSESDFSHPYYWAPFILIGNGL